jgi:hypothetical protein
MADNVIQQSGVVATLAEFGDFEKVTGGVPTTEYSAHFEAGAKIADQIPGTTMFTDMVLERAYRAERDQALVNWHNQYLQGAEGPRNVVKKISAYNQAVVASESYQVKPVSVETPEGVSGDNTIAMVKVTLKVQLKL